MLKHFLLSGSFRLKPFVNYVVIVTLIAPLVAASGNSTSAKQFQVAKTIPQTTELNVLTETETAAVNANSTQVSKAAVQNDSLVGQSYSVPMSVAATKPQLLQDKFKLRTEENALLSQKMSGNDELAAVQLLPPLTRDDSMSEKVSASQRNLVQRLRSAKIHIRSVTRVDGSVSKQVLSAESLSAAKIEPSLREFQGNSTKGSAVEQLNQESLAQQNDPIGSPYPIPWKWIQATQEAISSKGGSGVRYYRSIPVVSPDGRYAVYSRVQLEVKPEMYNSRVTSVLFVEDRQAKKLQVVTATHPINDPLLKVKVSSLSKDTQGSIGVLVPVSWSASGDRFLARKFEGLMNTSDVRDHAVIWDRQKNRFHCVTPKQEQVEHEIAVLLGWSKTYPDHVLFRAGEMGEENWPLVTVASDGSTVIAPQTDQPVIFGQKFTELWAGPPVAYR